jgi:hypothetical protein
MSLYLHLVAIILLRPVFDVEVNSTLGWDTGNEVLGAARNSESDHSQTLPAAPQAAAA